MSNVYYDQVLQSIPRLLSLVDRSRSSKTYGCCDRTFWLYKTVDFPSARYQETALMLALLYAKKFPGNTYYQQPQVKEWANAIMEFWCSIQEANGSFNEWYPHENSFVATAFTTYAVSEALLILGDVRSKTRIQRSLVKAADWLLENLEQRVTNQSSGAAIALYNVYKVTGSEKYRSNANEKITTLLKTQNSEGWWKEYTGPDTGYLSLMTCYLMKYYEKTKRRDVLDAIDKALAFLSYFAHPDLSMGGVYGCRNTAYFIPFAAEMRASNSKSAAYLAAHAQASLTKGGGIGPLSLDDRYLAYTGYEWLQAGLVSRPRLYKQWLGRKVFPKGKLFVVSTQSYYLAVNLAKGGAFYFVSKSASVSDDGVHLVGKPFASGWVDDRHTFSVKDDTIRVSGPLFKLPQHTATIGKMAGLRVFQSTLGRNQKVGLTIKKILRDKLITNAKAAPITYRREFTLGKDSVTVKDSLSKNELFFVGVPDQAIYVPSTNYFQPAATTSVAKEGRGQVTRTLT